MQSVNFHQVSPIFSVYYSQTIMWVDGLILTLHFLEIYTIEDTDEELKQCIREIKHRLENMGTILVNSNEAMRCEYISVILHTSLCIVKRITKEEITLAPQLEIVGEENTGWVDYAIKDLEELICITEGKLYQMVIGFAQNLI